MSKSEELALRIKKMQEELVKLQREEEEMKKPIPFNPEGTWKVTTEGDCEGRSTRQLGTYDGHILDIVKHLAGQAYYQLTLERVKPRKVDGKTIDGRKKSVQFHVTGDERIKWGESNDQLRALTQHLRDGEELESGNYYSAVRLTWEGK